MKHNSLLYANAIKNCNSSRVYCFIDAESRYFYKKMRWEWVWMSHSSLYVLAWTAFSILSFGPLCCQISINNQSIMFSFKFKYFSFEKFSLWFKYLISGILDNSSFSFCKATKWNVLIFTFNKNRSFRKIPKIKELKKKNNIQNKPEIVFCSIVN